ncbi:FtsK/SpoIIIE domain-containing protein [Paenibacillus sp. J31TS4]|uniref:FtsK/SpoIIIE domain-containing protein n=1 Tax=Paenibacillus sp. J31TS4 TaxID=2807195 RepID=UPI001BCD7A5E|nr:FtsK/SpoIIIE domain-containing protein [Paenibacillus sp. J31TS4]
MSALALAKGVGLAASVAGMWATWRTMPETETRAKLRQVFRLAEICLKTKKPGGKELRVYPTIRRIGIYRDAVRVTFTLPVGLDPAEVYKHLWMFKQQFGEHSELSGDVKLFTLTIYGRNMESFRYRVPSVPEGIGLPVYAGSARSGPVIYDMTEHPHLLIAGETGSGKSTVLRSIITTMILTMPPDRLQLYMADLKRSEFHLFKGVEHVQEVVVDSGKLRGMLAHIHKELVQRGDLLDAAGCAHVDELEEPPAYIILAIDEVALLKKEKACMEAIEEISAIGRALGVFLILSMQRPDADVLDGKLKNNLTVRMAFKHSDEINSRITLGSGDAAHLRDKGRMWLKIGELQQVQAPLLDLQEARKLLEPHKKKKAAPEAAQPQEEVFDAL